MLTVSIDTGPVQALMRQIQQRGGDLAPVMRDIGEILLESTQERFKLGVDPDGVPWKPVKRGGTPLVRRGNLRDDIAPVSDSTSVELRSTRAYAPYHQYGTGPYTIRPRTKRALAWPGGPGPRRRVNHPGIAARPFLGVSRADIDAVAALLEAYLLD